MKIIDIFSRPRVIILYICIILFILPFFWLKPGELELGGDSSRLYLYDPISYLQTSSLYNLAPDGIGNLRSDQSMIPFLLLLQIVYSIFRSPYILTILLYSVNLVGAFLFTYLFVFTILKNHTNNKTVFLAHLAAIIGGLFYTFSPSVGGPMQTALIIHNQVFLNPMTAYFLLMFLLSQKSIYLWLLLLTTVIFAPNFSLAVPALFAFYPLVLIFLFLYIRWCLKKSISWGTLFFGGILFLGLHAFHLVPVIVNTFDAGSYLNQRVFNPQTIQNEGINYFNAILPYAMVNRSFFYTYAIPGIQWAAIIGPLCITLGFLLAKPRQKDFTLIAIFFFVTTFFESANITELGVNIYRMLFYIPGFSMFRNFYGQWQWVQAFFYTLLLGYALFLLFSRFKKRAIYILSTVIVAILVYNSWMFVSGGILRQPHRATKGVSMVIQMDPHYEKTLHFLKKRSDDGRIFDLPFTEFSYQVVPGINKGAYIGPSPIGYLTGKKDFSGQIILYPFSDTFLRLIEEKKYDDIKRLFGLLNVRYIFYNADPRAYEAFFPELPYTLLLKVLPDSQSLGNFVKEITEEKIFQSGSYRVYNSDKAYFLPHFYVPTAIVTYGEKDDWMGQNASFFIDSLHKTPRVGYLKKDICSTIFQKSRCNKNEVTVDTNLPRITYKKINPTKYNVIISGAKKPFLLIFSDKFHPDWKAFVSIQKPAKIPIQRQYFNGDIKEGYHDNTFFDSKTFETFSMKSIPENQHVMVNGYANAWYIVPRDVSGRDTYEIIIELTQQRVVYFSLGISIVSFIIFIIYGIKIFKK